MTVCLIIMKLLYPLIIGCNFLQEQKSVIDMGNGIVTVQEREVSTISEGGHEGKDICQMTVMTNIAKEIGERIDKCNQLNKERNILIDALLQEKYVFREKRDPIKGYEFRIEVTKEQSFQGKTYPVPIAYREGKGKSRGNDKSRSY